VADADLLREAIAGDSRALAVLYERHHGPVYRFARRIGASIAMAEDVTHDCFVLLIKEAGRFDPSRASLRTFLCTVARSQTYSRLRREGREVLLDDTYERAAAPDTDPIVATERRDAVEQAIARLPPLQREALVLFEYEELGLSEIAAIVRADIGTVKSRLHRARQSLRRMLAPWLVPGLARRHV
jgi:RNA polymerase sigma-70 factor (ECF subfamily)